MAARALAVEFESTAVKVVHLAVSGRNRRVLHAAVVPLGEVARYPEGESRNVALARLLMEAMPPVPPKDPVVVGLSGRNAMLRYVQAPPVSARRLETLMTFEAESQAVGGSLAFDYLPLDIPAPGGTRYVALAVAQKQKLAELSAVCAKAGLPSVAFSPSCFGLYDAWLAAGGKDSSETVVIADIGAENMNLVFVRGSRFLFARNVAGGGARITSLIAETLGVSLSEAEQIKCERARLLDEEELAAAGELERKLHRAVASGVSVFAGALESTLLYCRNQLGVSDLEVNRLLLTGGTSRIPGIERAFSVRLNLPVERLDPFDGASGNIPSENGDLLASAFGLALGAAGFGASLSLRTSDQRDAEHAARHDRFAVIGSAVLALGMLLGAGGLLLFDNTYDSYARTFKQRLKKDERTHEEFVAAQAKLDRLHAEIEYLLSKTAPSVYMLEVLDLVKKTLDDEKNAKRFETLFFERIYMGEEQRSASSEPTRFNPFARRKKSEEAEDEAEDKGLARVHLIGWCRDRLPSNAIEMVREFSTELKEKHSNVVEDFRVRSLEEIKEEKPDRQWIRKPYLIRFEIVLLMRK